jgi:hypothetical protein
MVKVGKAVSKDLASLSGAYSSHRKKKASYQGLYSVYITWRKK